MAKIKPIRIAYIIGKMWAGGVESTVFNYYRAINKNKYQFDFFYDADSTVEAPRDLIEMGAKFYKLPPYQKIWEYIPELGEIIKENNYQIIHSHLNTLSVFPLFVAWNSRIPVRIAHNHSVPGGNEWSRNAIKFFLKQFSKVFATNYCACSEKAGRWLFGDKAFDNGKVLVIKNAIDFTKYRPDIKKRIRIRQELGIVDKFVIGHVGRFTYSKNHEFLINIFKIISQKRKDSVLLLIGDGELHSFIINTINAQAIEERVILVGKTNKTEDYYQAMDVLVLPSRFEGLSMAAVEAQACGVPIVISAAIPKEALIGNAYISLPLTETADIWADSIIASEGKSIQFNNQRDDYDINVAVQKLEVFYDNLLGINRGGGIL